MGRRTYGAPDPEAIWAQLRQVFDPEDFGDLVNEAPEVFEKERKFREQEEARAAEKQAGVLRLINYFRVRGHQAARLDPLGLAAMPRVPDLDPAFHGLGAEDMDTVFNTGTLAASADFSSPRNVTLNAGGQAMSVGLSSANFVIVAVINGSDPTNVSGSAHIITIRLEAMSFLIGYAFAMAAALCRA